MNCTNFGALPIANCALDYSLLGQQAGSWAQVPKSCFTGGGSSVTYTGITSQKLGTAGAMNGLSLVVIEPLATGTYHVTLNTLQTPVGFLTVTLGAGSFTITSTAVEAALNFTYLITTA